MVNDIPSVNEVATYKLKRNLNNADRCVFAERITVIVLSPKISGDVKSELGRISFPKVVRPTL